MVNIAWPKGCFKPSILRRASFRHLTDEDRTRYKHFTSQQSSQCRCGYFYKDQEGLCRGKKQRLAYVSSWVFWEMSILLVSPKRSKTTISHSIETCANMEQHATAIVKKIPIFATVANETLVHKVAEKLVQKPYGIYQSIQSHLALQNSFKKDEKLIEEGSPQDHLLFIEKGEIARLKGGKEIDKLTPGKNISYGVELTLAIQGSVSGMLHLVDRAPSFATLVVRQLDSFT